MPPLDKPDALPAAVRWQLPAIHPDGRKFIVAGAIAALFCWWVIDWDTLGWWVAGLTGWIAAFFRDPVRTTPIAAGLVVAPADGLVTMIATVPPPPELVGPDALGDAPLVCISIHMSPFDCHIIRTPIAGAVSRLAYIAGRFVNPELDKASAGNERQHLLIEGEGGCVGVTLIAGVVGRRIVPWVQPGHSVTAGQRIGITRFGSRTDVYLPEGTGSELLLGQRTIAGETIVARLGISGLIEGVAQ